VDEEANYKQKIVQWCFDGASPPLTVEVSDPIPTPSGNGKVCCVISVAESDVAPHFLNGRKGVWVRADEFSARFEARLADEDELRHLFDRRKLVLERREFLLDRARKRFGVFAARLHSDRGGTPTAVGPTLELCIVPRFPARQLCRQEELKSLVQKSWMSWRSVMFPDPSSSILSQYESAIVLAAARDLSFFEVNAWGMLFYAAKIEADHNGIKGIHLGQFVGYLLLFVRHAGKMLRSMGSGGPIHIETTINSLLRAQWLNPQQGWFSPHPGSELDDDVTFSISTTSEELNENPDGVVATLLRNVFFAVNWAGIVETAQGLEGLIRLGYTFNFWNQPTSLKI
jgi:hypothetical protein